MEINMVEEWRDIAGFEGLYQVSSLGRVKSLNYKRTGKEKILKSGKSGKGYLQVQLWKNGNGYVQKVHRLVADTFITNKYNLQEVNHKDENKENNNVSNLEWISHKDNINYGTRNKRASKPIMCVETRIIFPSSIEAARKTGTNQGNIISCCRGNLKTAGGFHWRYAE